MDAQHGGQLQYREYFLFAGAELQGLADVATHAWGIQMSARGVDGDRDQFDGLWGQHVVAQGMHGHGEEFLDPLGVQFGQRVPGGIPVAGIAHGIAGRREGFGLIQRHGQFLYFC
ncbi:hypothetical protein D3C80_1501170 [compost metagenome]